MELELVTQDLITSAKLGNEEALNKLFAKYQAKILRIVRLRLSKNLRPKLKLQSMDIVQEVFMYAFQRLKDFEPKSQGHFLNWLSKKVEHYIYDRLDYISRMKREAPGGEISLDQEARPDPESGHFELQIKDNGLTPRQFAVKKEKEHLIDTLLDMLEPAERELIIQRDLEELSFVEIGELIGKSEDATRKQYCRAFQKLMELSEEKIKPIMAEESFRQYNG